MRGLIARRTAVLAVLVILLGCLSACKRAKPDKAALAPEQNAPLASVVNVNDPATSSQLVRGFHGLENNSWRWTMKKFEVALKPPPNAAQAGARLNFKLTIPEVIFSRLGPITLSATVNGAALPPETYMMAGDYVYTRDIPASALNEPAVIASFASDKGISPSANDARELALIAISIRLEPPGPEPK